MPAESRDARAKVRMIRGSLNRCENNPARIKSEDGAEGEQVMTPEDRALVIEEAKTR